MEGTLLRKLHIFIILPVMLMVLFGCLKSDASCVYAADIGTITVDGSTTSYGSFTNLCNDLSRLSDKTVTIDMLTDWDVAKDDQFDNILYIPSKCTATFNMHGHMFNMNYDTGPAGLFLYNLIKVDSDAALTINGSSTDDEKATEHPSVPVFTDTGQDTPRGSIEDSEYSAGNSRKAPDGAFLYYGSHDRKSPESCKKPPDFDIRVPFHKDYTYAHGAADRILAYQKREGGAYE